MAGDSSRPSVALGPISSVYPRHPRDTRYAGTTACRAMQGQWGLGLTLRIKKRGENFNLLLRKAHSIICMRKSKRDLTSTRGKINSVSCTANLDTDMCQFLIVGIGFLPNDRSGWISFHSFFIGQINFLLQPSLRNIMKCKTRKTRSSTKRSSGTQ